MFQWLRPEFQGESFPCPVHRGASVVVFPVVIAKVPSVPKGGLRPMPEAMLPGVVVAEAVVVMVIVSVWLMKTVKLSGVIN